MNTSLVGKIFHVNPDEKTFVLLKETEYDPRTNEGTSRITVQWSGKTQFIRIDSSNSLAGVDGPVNAQVTAFRNADFTQLPADAPIITLDVKVFVSAPVNEGVSPDGSTVAGRFTPADDTYRTGSITFNDITLPVQLRGPRANVEIHAPIAADEIFEGFWDATVTGQEENGRFIADQITVIPKTDPRTVDDPALPRVLVIGDSISMNYHETAKAELAGIANYYRVEGNAGPSDRGVTCIDLWLGEYTEPGLHWDLIQFNHGLHDLKQTYDPETGEYGAFQVDLDIYKANLEKEIDALKKTGAKLMWCTTTPVPQSSAWASQDIGRKHGADLIFNAAAMEVISKHPDIMINDLNTAVRNASFYSEWSQGEDVHFWNETQKQEVGKAVANAIKNALSKTS